MSSAFERDGASHRPNSPPRVSGSAWPSRHSSIDMPPPQRLPPVRDLLAAIPLTSQCAVNFEGSYGVGAHDAPTGRQHFADDRSSSLFSAPQAPHTPTRIVGDTFDSYGHHHRPPSHYSYPDAVSSNPTFVRQDGPRAEHTALPPLRTNALPHLQAHPAYHGSSHPGSPTSGYGQTSPASHYSPLNHHQPYHNFPAPDAHDQSHAFVGVEGERYLQLVPGLCPSASGHQQNVYEGTRQIGDEVVHVYSGGYYLPSVVNGEKVNATWGLTKANTPRKRLSVACDRCRQKKTRCDPSGNGCLQCQRAGRSCQTSFAGEVTTPHRGRADSLDK